MEKNNIIYLKLLAVAFFWGGTFIATRLAAQEVLPFLGALLRFLFAVIALLFLLKIKKETFFPIKKETFWWNVGLAFSGIIVYNYFFFSALKILPASRASLLVSLNPIIVLFAGAFFYKDKLTVSLINFGHLLTKNN